MGKEVIVEKTDTVSKVTFGNALENRQATTEALADETNDESTGDEFEEDETSLEAATEEESDEDEGEEETTEESEEGEEEEEETTEEETTEGDDDDEEVEEVTAPAKPVKKVKADATTSEADTAAASKNVPLQALLSEREKRQNAERKLLAYEKGEVPLPDAEKAPAFEELENRLNAMSVNNARSVNLDYDEKYQAVAKAAQENPALLDLINPEDPGQSCYELGENLMFVAKYGKTLKEQTANLKKEAREEFLKEKGSRDSAEVLKKLQKQKKTPINISKARAAGGSTEPEYEGKSFGKRLKR